MKIIIPGRPVPAVRMTQRSKYKSKQAQRYLEYKESVGWAAKAKFRTPGETDVHVHAIAYLDPSKPDMDVDNLAKSFLDGMNGIAWIDDKQVMKLIVEKRWVFDAMEQRAEIEVWAHENTFVGEKQIHHRKKRLNPNYIHFSASSPKKQTVSQCVMKPLERCND